MWYTWYKKSPRRSGYDILRISTRHTHLFAHAPVPTRLSGSNRHPHSLTMCILLTKIQQPTITQRPFYLLSYCRMYSNSPSAQTGTRIYWQCASHDEIFANVNIQLVSDREPPILFAVLLQNVKHAVLNNQNVFQHLSFIKSAITEIFSPSAKKHLPCLHSSNICIHLFLSYDG